MKEMKENTETYSAEEVVASLKSLKEKIKKMDFTNYEKEKILRIIDFALFEVFDIEGEYYTKNMQYPFIEDYIENNEFFDDSKMDKIYFIRLIFVLYDVYSMLEGLTNKCLSSIGKDKLEIFEIMSRIWDYTLYMSDIFYEILYKLDERGTITLAIDDILNEDIVTENDGESIKLGINKSKKNWESILLRRFRARITESELKEEKLIEKLPNAIDRLQKLKIQINDSEVLEYNKDKMLYFLNMILDELGGKSINVNINKEVSKFNDLEIQLSKELYLKKINKMPKEECYCYLRNQISLCANAFYVIRKCIIYFTVADVPSLKIDCDRMEILSNILNTFMCANIAYLSLIANKVLHNSEEYLCK